MKITSGGRTFGSFEEMFDAWEAEKMDFRREHPVRYFFTETIPNCYWAIHRPIRDGWYWLKCLVWHRYNVVFCRDLPPTWVDRDELLLHAAFQILKDFVEREEMPSGEWSKVCADRKTLLEWYKEFGPDEAERRTAGWLEVRALYDWWEIRRLDDDRDDHEGDTEMLARLVKVRGYLWT